MLVKDYVAAIEQLPLTPMDAALGSGALVVLAPHPDDETLGCGGLIAAACEMGRRVEVAILTDGSGSHPGSRTYPPPRLAALRRDEAACAVTTLGVPLGRLTFLDFKDTAAPQEGPDFGRAVDALSAIVARADASDLFVTWEHDPHCDHEAAAAIARAVAMHRPGLRLWRYPVWGLHRPPEQIIEKPPPRGFRLDISPWLTTKRAALECHASQLGRVIDDDPTGFQLEAETLRPFLLPFERFLGEPS